MAFALRLTRRFKALRPPAFWRPRAKVRPLNSAGSIAVEFAFIAPILVMMMLGVFTYGGYFLTAHTLQQLTNDAARAAIAGVDDDERRWLATEAVRTGIIAQRYMHGELSEVDIDQNGANLVVTVRYDATADLFWATRAIVPVPSPIISRTASIRLGGL